MQQQNPRINYSTPEPVNMQKIEPSTDTTGDPIRFDLNR